MKEQHSHRHDTAARLAKNSVFVLLSRGTDLGVAFVSTAFIARYLGLVDFGYFSFVTAVTIFLVPFTDFGFERIITREIAADRRRADRLIGAAIIARVFLSVVIVFSIYVLTLVMHWDRNVVLAIYLSALTQLIASMGMLSVGTFRAYERMDFEFLLNFMLNIAYMIFLFIAISLDLGFLSVFGARLLASFLHMVLVGLVSHRTFVRPVFETDMALIRHLFREATPLGFFALLLTASFKANVFILNYFGTPQDISIYEAANRLIMQIQVIPTALVISLFPHFSRLARESGDALRLSFFRSFKLMLIASLPIPIVMTFASRFIVMVLYGEKFAAAVSSLSILSWTIPSLFLVSLQSFVLTSQGRQTLNTMSVSVCFAVNILTSVVLVPHYSYVGASIATLMSYGAFFLVSSYFVSKSVGSVATGRMLLKPLMSAAVTGIGCAMLYNRVHPALVPVWCVAAFLIYGSILYKLNTFDAEELAMLKSVVLKRRRPAAKVAQ